MSQSSISPQEKRHIRVNVNGVLHTIQVETRWLLSDFLRHELHLTGTHVGCEHGVCGACTILFNGAPVRSCLMLAVQVDGADILTVEGLAKPDGSLHPLQQAFHQYHGLQCGFCTPGFLMAIYAFLQDHPDPDISDEALREALAGNLCRCTGYQGIIAAVRHVLLEARAAQSAGEKAEA
ncbi:(2Fe-2S)-binding protein [Ktedonosporobacter rubrisoli]|uniref:(2Fe-2S)-binding protein n=1 Tax=Ktedonosporobacter rubrisoli TaxID=2509675 RepID=A0A4P6K3X8_KTERU|nr:(2Fe-2S)-binding protein [Ktedonosporobacter rubrisoli]QBD82755.1 (2Fe-2S)-binding protein [Ktedonosporobacter rubrisoli]